MSASLITNLQTNLKPLPPEAEHGWWYPLDFADSVVDADTL